MLVCMVSYIEKCLIFVISVVISVKNVYVVGIEECDGKRVATLWENGRMRRLSSE